MPTRDQPRRLFYSAGVEETEEPGIALEGARQLPLDLIVANPNQPRQMFVDIAELAADITARGVLQPIVVRPHPTDPDRFMIVAGERRYRASLEAGKTTIPAIVRRYASDTDADADSAVENLQRSDLLYAEEAALYQRLLNAWGLRFATDLAERLHRPVRRIQRVLQLGEHPDLLEQVDTGRVTLREALQQLKRPDRRVGITEEEKRHGDVFSEDADDENTPATEQDEKRHRDVFSDNSAVSERSATRRSPSTPTSPWRPIQQFATWLAQTQPTIIPHEERATMRAQIAQMRERLDMWEQALVDEEG